jgi:hypothetical protein
MRSKPLGSIGKGHCLFLIRTLAILVILAMRGSDLRAYSVLTHEEMVDMVWKNRLDHAGTVLAESLIAGSTNDLSIEIKLVQKDKS